MLEEPNWSGTLVFRVTSIQDRGKYYSHTLLTCPRDSGQIDGRARAPVVISAAPMGL